MKLTNKYNLPISLVHAIENLCYDPRGADPKRLSVTKLINNPLPNLLNIKHWDEIEEDASEHIWRVAGSAMHWVLAQSEKDKEKSKTRLIETKLEEKIDDFTIVGKLDLYDESTSEVQDWKFTSVWSVQFGEHEEWEQQLNPYAWLLRKCGFKVEKASINALLKDWRKSELLKYADYPKIPFVNIPVKVWPFEQQQEFIEHRLEIYKEALKTPINELNYCNDKERWKKSDGFAVYKNENKARAARVLETAEEAEQYIKDNTNGKDKFNIVKRPGVDLKCTEYCSVNQFCNYYKETYEQQKSQET